MCYVLNERPSDPILTRSGELWLRLGLMGSLCLGQARLVIMREETGEVWEGRVELGAHGADD